MSSTRELIAENVVEVLKDMRDPKPVWVTRETFDVDNLSRQQIPAILVTSLDESREEFTMASSNQRLAVLTMTLECYVQGTNLDTQRNDLIERIEETLALDTTRGSNAHKTQVVEINVNNDIEPPMGAFTVNVQIEYIYTRGVL